MEAQRFFSNLHNILTGFGSHAEWDRGCTLAHNLTKPRILVVDDHRGNQLALETLLGNEYIVDLASTGAEALKFVLKNNYAVILLDVRMPVMDGFETAMQLRKNPRVKDTPIIFTSAYDQSDAQIAKGYQVGGSDYLLSPVDSDFLKLKMRTYVRMYLRIEALRIHIDRLTNLLQSMQLEVNGRPDEEALHAQVRELEQVVADLRREMVPTA